MEKEHLNWIKYPENKPIEGLFGYVFLQNGGFFEAIYEGEWFGYGNAETLFQDSDVIAYFD